jgi:hypothetical protein
MEGFAEGTMVTVKDESPRYQSTSGCDGEIAVSVTADRRVNVTLSLLQTSDSNDILAAQDRLADTSPGIAGWGPVHIRDLNGRTLYEGKALIVERPESTFGATAKNRDWKLLCVFTSRFDGGSTAVA